MEKNNKGFTMIEVIVVIAIMAVLVGMGTQIFGLTDNGYIKRASADLKSLLDQAEYNTQAIAAKEWRVEITKEGDAYVAKLIKVETETDSSGKTKDVETEIDKKTLSGGKKLQIFFDANSISKQEVTESVPLKITFEKQSGEVNKVEFDKPYSSAELKADEAAGKGNITISTNGTTSHDKTINIYWSTGKIFMK